MYDVKYFERVPGRCGGLVTYIGRRLQPTDVKGFLDNPGWALEDIKKDYDLTDEQIQAAKDFNKFTAYDEESEQKYIKDSLNNKQDTSFGGVFPGRRK